MLIAGAYCFLNVRELLWRKLANTCHGIIWTKIAMIFCEDHGVKSVVNEHLDAEKAIKIFHDVTDRTPLLQNHSKILRTNACILTIIIDSIILGQAFTLFYFIAFMITGAQPFFWIALIAVLSQPVLWFSKKRLTRKYLFLHETQLSMISQFNSEELRNQILAIEAS